MYLSKYVFDRELKLINFDFYSFNEFIQCNFVQFGEKFFVILCLYLGNILEIVKVVVFVRGKGVFMIVMMYKLEFFLVQEV